MFALLAIRPLLFFVGLCALFNLACGAAPAEPEVRFGQVSAASPSFSDVAVPAASPTAVPRLVIPTFTPEPTATLPAFSRLAPSNEPVALDFVPLRTLPPDPPAQDCVGRYRQMLLEYDGRDPFGAETAILVSNELLLERPDCAFSGWAPEPSLERVCRLSEVGGADLPDGLVRLVGDFNRREADITRRDDVGNVLIHFGRMPLADVSGCWFYSAGLMIWYWTLESGVVGFDRVVLTGCDFALQSRLLEAEFVSAVDVVRMSEAVRGDYPDSCGVSAWRQYPQLRPGEDCSIQSETGMFRDGSFVVNWHPEFPASDGAICWYWSSAEGLWSFSYPEVE